MVPATVAPSRVQRLLETAARTSPPTRSTVLYSVLYVEVLAKVGQPQVCMQNLCLHRILDIGLPDCRSCKTAARVAFALSPRGSLIHNTSPCMASGNPCTPHLALGDVSTTRYTLAR